MAKIDHPKRSGGAGRKKGFTDFNRKGSSMKQIGNQKFSASSAKGFVYIFLMYARLFTSA